MEVKIGIGPASSSAPTIELADFQQFSYRVNVDEGASITATASGTSDASRALAELSTDLWLYLNGRLEQRFRVLSVQEQYTGDGAFTLTVAGGDYRRVLARRIVQSPLTFTNVGQGSIGWALIDHAQQQVNGDLGLTQGATADAITRVRNYELGENIGALLVNLSQVIDGCRFEIDGNLVVSSIEPGSFPQLAQPVILGVSALSMTRGGGSSVASTFSNAALVFGDAERTSPALAVAQSLPDDPRGRWDAVETFSTVVQQNTLTEAAEGLVEQRVSPVSAWTVELDPLRWTTDLPMRPWDECTLVKPSVVVSNDPAAITPTTRRTTTNLVRATTTGNDRSTTRVVELPQATVAEAIRAQCVDLAVSYGANGETTVTVALIETPT